MKTPMQQAMRQAYLQNDKSRRILEPSARTGTGGDDAGQALMAKFG